MPFLAVTQLTQKLNSDVSETGNAAPGFLMTLFAVVPDIGGEFPIALYSLPQDKIFSGNLLWRRSLGRQAEGADFARCGRTQAFHFQGGQLLACDLLRLPFPHRSNCGAVFTHRR